MSEAAPVPFSETKAPESADRLNRGALGLVDIAASTMANIGPAYSFMFGFGLFGLNPCVSHAYIRLVDFGKPVKLAGVEIEPGDLIHADKHGVCTIPIEIADRLADAARHGFATRKLIQRHGHLTIAVLMGHSDDSMIAKVYGHLDKNTEFLKKVLVD